MDELAFRSRALVDYGAAMTSRPRVLRRHGNGALVWTWPLTVLTYVIGGLFLALARSFSGGSVAAAG